MNEEDKADTPCDLGGWARCSQGCLRLHNMGDPHYIERPGEPRLEAEWAAYSASMRKLAERRWR